MYTVYNTIYGITVLQIAEVLYFIVVMHCPMLQNYVAAAVTFSSVH